MQLMVTLIVVLRAQFWVYNMLLKYNIMILVLYRFEWI